MGLRLQTSIQSRRPSPSNALQQPEVQLVLGMLKVASIIDVDQMGWITASDLREEDGQGQGWVRLQPSWYPWLLSVLRVLGAPELTIPQCTLLPAWKVPLR